MSAGPGRAERAILDAVAEARSPLGAPRWLTVEEIAGAAGYRLPLAPIERNSLSRAARKLAEKGNVLTAKAGERWTNRKSVAPSVLRPDLRRGALLVRSATLNRSAQDPDQGISRISTELLEGDWSEGGSKLPEDLLRPQRDVPEGIPFSTAGDTYDIESAAEILNGTSRTRVSRLQTDKPPLLAEGPAPAGTSQPPRAFSSAEFKAMGHELNEAGTRWRPRRHDSDDWELLDDPGCDDDEPDRLYPLQRTRDDPNDLQPWERDLIEAGELDPDWRVELEPEDPEPKLESPAQEPESNICVRCGSPAVKPGACAEHLCANCHEQPWHAKRLCRACAEYARTHKGTPRPARLWKKNRR